VVCKGFLQAKRGSKVAWGAEPARNGSQGLEGSMSRLFREEERTKLDCETPSCTEGKNELLESAEVKDFMHWEWRVGRIVGKTTDEEKKLTCDLELPNNQPEKSSSSHEVQKLEKSGKWGE